MRVLVVEDDLKLNRAIVDLLSKQYVVDSATNGEDGLYLASEGIYDLIVLDIMLPKMDGYEVLKQLRQVHPDVPVIYISAKDSVEDRIKGLQLQSDDYLVKPFHEMELVLRIQAILKRNEKTKNLHFGELELLQEGRTLSCRGDHIFLKGKQYELLEYLMQNPNRILTKEQIFDKVWGIYSDTTITVVEVYAHAIRKLLKPYHLDYYIKTIRGVGYMLTLEESKK